MSLEPENLQESPIAVSAIRKLVPAMLGFHLLAFAAAAMTHMVGQPQSGYAALTAVLFVAVTVVLVLLTAVFFAAAATHIIRHNTRQYRVLLRWTVLLMCLQAFLLAPTMHLIG
jgi:Na+/H+ antiporter NhaD/arsenite permease-like protein